MSPFPKNKPWPHGQGQGPEKSHPYGGPASPPTYDPFLRPAAGVSIEEWRMLVCAVAGGFRLAQGFTKVLPALAPNESIHVVTNTKSFALFVSIQVRPTVAVAPFALSKNEGAPDVGSLEFSVAANQILLPKERLFMRNTGIVARTWQVTEVTV